jgi:uncharacterized protein YndB with AHSA1/START domain
MITRTFNAPAACVYEAWTKPELLTQWWTPKSFGLSFLSCEIDARTGGRYRFVFRHASAKEPMTFFGRYIEVTPPSSSPGRLAWTNEEEGGNGAVTTVTFEERGAATLLTVNDTTGAPDMSDEQFAQLDLLLAR